MVWCCLLLLYIKLQLHDRIKWAVRRLLDNAARRKRKNDDNNNFNNHDSNTSSGGNNSHANRGTSSTGRGVGKGPMVSWDWAASVSDPMEMIHKVVLPAVASLAAAPVDLLSDDANTTTSTSTRSHGQLGDGGGRLGNMGKGGSSNVDLLTELSDAIEAHQLHGTI